MKETSEKKPLHTTAIILAAGTGSRMTLGYNKILFEIGEPIIVHSIAAFEQSPNIDTIVVVAAEGEVEKVRTLVEQAQFTKVSAVICGGASRQESSRRGIESLHDADIIAIHDAARPFVSQETITATIVAARTHGASVAAVPVKDTLKVVDGKGVIEKTLDRSIVYSAQTPQTFQTDIIRTAHAQAFSDRYEGTDDASLVERLGMNVVVVPGTYDNIKFPTPEDLTHAEVILKSRKPL